MLMVILPLCVFAEQDLGLGVKAAYGDWKWMGDRLVQLDVKAGMAMAYVYLPQNGVIQYEFKVRYLAGGADMYGGFGAHVGIDKPHSGKSWGNGRSFLLWATLDPKAYGGSGVYGQAYKSLGHSSMDILHGGDDYQVPASRLAGVDLNKMQSYVLPVKIVIDYRSGWSKIYDPVVANYYYKFTLGGAIRNGLYVALRTNSLALSFSDFKVTKLQ